MITVLTPLSRVIESGRLDFSYFNPLKEDQIDLAKGYEVARLDALCLKIQTGKTAARGAYTTSGVRIVKVKNVRGNGIDWSEKFCVSEEFYRSAKKKASLQLYDLLMLCSAHNASYIGRTDIVLDFPKDVETDEGRCLSVGELIIIRADSELVNPEYLLAFLRLGVTQEKIQRMVKGQSAHLYPTDLGELEVVLPPRRIQDEIAELNREAEATYRSAILRAENDLADTKALIRRVVFQGEECAAPLSDVSLASS